MIKVSVFYPGGEGKTFDMEYYCLKHMPMVAELLGDDLKAVTVEKGIGGADPGSPPVYVAMGNLYFETLEAYQQSFGANVDKFGADLPNFTNIDPVVLISEVMM